jgi:hypothetical protein
LECAVTVWINPFDRAKRDDANRDYRRLQAPLGSIVISIVTFTARTVTASRAAGARFEPELFPEDLSLNLW